MNLDTLIARRDSRRGEVIAGWAASGVHSRQIAAAWARELLAQQSSQDKDQDEAEKVGSRADSTMKFAARMGVPNSTAARARRLLVGAGFLRQQPDRHYYYVR